MPARGAGRFGQPVKRGTAVTGAGIGAGGAGRGSVMRPILSASSQVNQTLPSGPALTPVGEHSSPDVWIGTSSVTTPSVVIRPIRLPNSSVNHKAPSGPAVMYPGWLPAFGSSKRLALAPVSTRPMAFPNSVAFENVNQSAPSGPVVIENGPAGPDWNRVIG